MFASSESLSPTLLSVLAEVKLQADRYRSPIEIVKLDARVGSNCWLYSFERRLLGLGTGVHDGVLIFRGSHFSNVGPRALDEILGKRCVAALRVFSDTSNADFTPWKQFAHCLSISNVREALPLASSYGEFLRALGKHTRRNIQQCRKWAAGEGIRVERRHLNSEEVSKLALQNMPTPKQPARILQTMRHALQQARPFELSLSMNGDELFSTAGGYIDGDCAFLIYQANDRRYRSLNPSLMLRAFLIEELIDRGVRHLAFVGGCAGVLMHQCDIVPTGELLLVRNTMLAGLKHWTASALTNETNRIVRLAPQFV